MAPARKRDKKEESIAGNGESNRHIAEKKIADRQGLPPGPREKTPDELIQELRVHQIELEMQADELRRAQLALEEARDRFLDLYDFAPIGYITLTDKALVHEVNLTGAKLLGMTRNTVIETRFRKFINPDDSNQWDRYFMSLLMQDTSLTTTLLLRRADGSIFPARLEGIRLSTHDGMPMVRIAFSDVTDIRRAEEVLHQRLRMEELISTIAHRFISTAAGEIAGELRHALGRIGEFTGADRCMITLLSGDAGTIEETYEWCPDRADPIDYYLTGMSVAGFPWLLSMMARGEQVIVPRLEVLPPVAEAEQKFLKNIGTKGGVITPLALSGHLIGMFFVLHRRGRKWTETDRSLLETARDLFVNVIARKRNVDALMESEQKYRTLFDNYLNPIIIAGDDGRLTDANTAAIDFMERGVNDIQQRPVRELMPGFDLVMRQTPLASCHRTIETEYTIHGTTKNLLVQVVPLTIGNRTILYGIGQDITARKRAEQLVREQKTFLETILREAADGIVVCDARGSYLYLNDAARRMAGIAMDADLGSIPPSSWGTAYRVDGRPIRREDWTLEKALRGISSVGLEVHLERVDGSAYDLLISAAPVRSPAQTIIGAVATFRDITGRKQAEMRVMESEAKLRALFEALPIGISLIDEHRNVIGSNPALERILDYSEEELARKEFTKRAYIRPDGTEIRPDEFPSIRALEENRTVQDVEIGIVKEGGPIIWTNVSAQPLPFPDWRVVLTTADITWKKQAERALRESEERFRHLASFTQENPAPILEVYEDGSVAFTNIAAGLALRRQGLPEDPKIFFPPDMEMILGELRKGSDAFYYREVPIGDAIYGESIYLSTIHHTIRMYAQDVTAYRQGRQERPG